MSRIDRRKILKSAFALTVASPLVLRVSKVRGADFTMKAATNDAASSPTSKGIVSATDAIRSATAGKIDIQVFPNSQLGSNSDMLSQLRSGALEFGLLSPNVLSVLIPQASVIGVGFAWPSYDRIWAAMDGELGALGRSQVQKSGLYAFEKIWDNGYRHISSSTRQILTPADLKGFRIRVPPSPLWTSLFKAFEAAPMSINMNETYSALQTNIAEGQENPFAIIYQQKLFEVQKYVSKTGHMWDGYWFLANAKIWSDLPLEARQVIETHLNAAAVQERVEMAALNGSLESELVGKGLIVKEVNTEPFRSKLQSAGFYKEWRTKYGEEVWTLLEKYAGQIS